MNCSTAEENWRAQYTTLKRKNHSEKKNVTKSALKKYYQNMKEKIQ
jgi:hypothetical protein